MKQFYAFAKKEFRHVFRDIRTMLILIVMPVIQIILFGFAISTEINNVNVMIVAHEYGENIRKISEKLDASKYFTVVGTMSDASGLDRAFQNGSTDMAILFAPGFEDNLFSDRGTEVQLVVDATNSNIATAETGYASTIMQDYFRACIPRAENTDMGIIPNVRMLYNPQMKSSYSFVPGVMGMIIILICAMMTSISIVREKETGTMEVLLASPMKPLTIIISKMVPYLLISFVNYATILLLSVTLLDIPIVGSLGTLTLLSVLYIVVALALGLFISSKMESQVAAMLASGMLLMMPVMFFSGLMFPVESMPGFFRVLSNVIPAKWYILGVKKIMIEGLPLYHVAKEFAILLFMAIFLMAVSLKQFKYRLK